MKANKRFYDKLREEVENYSGVATCFVAISKKTNIPEGETNPGEPVSGGKIVEKTEKDSMVNDWNDEIEALRAQIKMLEERNDVLTKENKSLQNNQRELSPRHDNEKGKGLIEVNRILEWAYVYKGDAYFITVLRNMLQEFDWDGILEKDDYCEDVKRYEKEFREKQNMPNGPIENYKPIIQQQINNLPPALPGLPNNNLLEE